MATKSGAQGRSPDNRRLTKAERREEARIQREEIKRRMARRKRNRTLGIALLALAVVAIVVVVVVVRPDETPSNVESPDALLEQAAAAKVAASCEDVREIGFYNDVSDTDSPDYVDQVHIGGGAFLSGPDLSTYPSVPPTSGPHAPIPPGPIAAGVYDAPPDIYRAIHSLEHGGTIVWYRPGTSDPALDRLIEFYSQTDVAVGQDRVIVAPYDYPDQGAAGELPGGVDMALVSWHRLQTCGQTSLPVAFDFTSQYSFPVFGDRPYQGEAPEPGASM